MGAYAYCRSCGNAMPGPTLKEAITGQYACGCGEERGIDEHEKEWIAEEINERVRHLEKQVAAIEAFLVFDPPEKD